MFLEWTSGLPVELRIFLVSMIPVVELRGAIPLGAVAGLPWEETYLLSVLGNLAPVPFIILLVRPVFAFLKRTRLLSAIIHRLEEKTMRKARRKIVGKNRAMLYTAAALCLFVAIPLPGTGAWTGAMIAGLVDMRLRYAVPAVVMGVLIAGVIMTGISYGFLKFLSFLA